MYRWYSCNSFLFTIRVDFKEEKPQYPKRSTTETISGKTLYMNYLFQWWQAQRAKRLRRVTHFKPYNDVVSFYTPFYKFDCFKSFIHISYSW